MNNIPKKWLTTIGVVLLCHSGFSQLSSVDVLLGMTESRITTYFDSLNRLKSNPAYKIERDVTPDGALMLKNSFSMADEPFYKCLDVSVVFRRINGKEVCISQLVFGSSQYASNYLNYVKDNFKYVEPNKWEVYYTDAPLKVVAEFSKLEGNYPSFSMIYRLQTIKETK